MHQSIDYIKKDISSLIIKKSVSDINFSCIESLHQLESIVNKFVYIVFLS